MKGALGFLTAQAGLQIPIQIFVGVCVGRVRWQAAGIYALSVWVHAMISDLCPHKDRQYEAAKTVIVGNDARPAILSSRLCCLT